MEEKASEALALLSIREEGAAGMAVKAEVGAAPPSSSSSSSSSSPSSPACSSLSTSSSSRGRRSESGGFGASNFMALFYRRQLQLSTSDFRRREEAQKALASRRLPPSSAGSSTSSSFSTGQGEKRVFLPHGLDAEAMTAGAFSSASAATSSGNQSNGSTSGIGSVSPTPRDIACFFRSATISLAPPSSASSDAELGEQSRLLRSDEANLKKQQELLCALRKRAALARRGSLITARTQQLTFNQQTDALAPKIARRWLAPLPPLPSSPLFFEVSAFASASSSASSSPSASAAVLSPPSSYSSASYSSSPGACVSSYSSFFLLDPCSRACETRARAAGGMVRRRCRSQPCRGVSLWKTCDSAETKRRAAEAAAKALATYGGVRLPGDWRRERPASIELTPLAAQAAARAASERETATNAARIFAENAKVFASLRRTASDTALNTRPIKAKVAGSGATSLAASSSSTETRLLSHAALTELMQQALEVSATVVSAAPEKAALVAEAVDSLVRALRLRVLQGRQRVELQLLFRQRARRTTQQQTQQTTQHIQQTQSPLSYNHAKLGAEESVEEGRLPLTAEARRSGTASKENKQTNTHKLPKV